MSIIHVCCPIVVRNVFTTRGEDEETADDGKCAHSSGYPLPRQEVFRVWRTAADVCVTLPLKITVFALLSKISFDIAVVAPRNCQQLPVSGVCQNVSMVACRIRCHHELLVRKEEPHFFKTLSLIIGDHILMRTRIPTSRSAINVLIEAGGLYLITQTIFLVLFAIQHPSQAIVGVMAVQIYGCKISDSTERNTDGSSQGIVPTLIIIRVGLGISSEQMLTLPVLTCHSQEVSVTTHPGQL